MAKTKYPWRNKVGNISQLGGIETSVIDNGPGRGSRIAWVNTGSGLRYKIVIDRALDIVAAFYNQHNLAWLSNVGLTSPRPDANTGFEWLYTFAGGFITTCGLTHIGGPESDENGNRGLHGRISNIPAEVESIIQPDPASGRMNMSITAIIKESRVFGPSLELKRTISSVLGESKIKIQDEVSNRGNSTQPHMILYHCNFGWPLIDEGTNIIYQGKCTSRGMPFDDAIFNNKRDYKKCTKPLKSHCGTGESCGFIDVKADKNSVCSVGVANHKINLALVIKYSKKNLPCLTNWQHFGPNEYVCALEPGTNFPVGQIKAKQQKELVCLRPGQSRKYSLEFEILSDSKKIEQFVKRFG
jgi:hypothetical protein